jgi:hypothetical protein
MLLSVEAAFEIYTYLILHPEWATSRTSDSRMQDKSPMVILTNPRILYWIRAAANKCLAALQPKVFYSPILF